MMAICRPGEYSFGFRSTPYFLMEAHALGIVASSNLDRVLDCLDHTYTSAGLLWKSQETIIHRSHIGDVGVVQLERRQVWPEHQSKSSKKYYRCHTIAFQYLFA